MFPEDQIVHAKVGKELLVIIGNDGAKSWEIIGISKKLGPVVGHCCSAITFGQGIDVRASRVVKNCNAKPKEAGESLCGHCRKRMTQSSYMQ